MDGSYQWPYPERELYECSPPSAGIAYASREREGLMDQLPMSLTPSYRLSSSMSDRIASVPHQYQLLMAPNNNAATADLRLSPSQPTPGYPNSDHGYDVDYRTNPLSNQDRHQEAWNPLHVTGVSDVPMPDASQEISKRRRVNASDSGTTYQSEGAFSDVGSQCHTEEPQSDPGYGTKSVATTSIIDYFRTNNTLVVPSREIGAGAQNTMAYPEIDFRQNGQSRDQRSRAGSDILPRQERVPVKCGVKNCTWEGKNLSDKTKHETRHRKPFVCDQQGCRRGKEGFGTKNDLNRHKKSVHSLDSENGAAGKLYKCFAENCKRRDKKWPRLDNFRQHLIRMHGECNMNELLKQSDMWFENMKKAHQQSPRSSTIRSGQPLLPTMGAHSQPPHDSVSSASSLGPWVQDNIKEKADGDSVMPADLIKCPENSVKEFLELASGESSRMEPNSDAVPFIDKISPVSDSRGSRGYQSNSRSQSNVKLQGPPSADSQTNQLSSHVYPFRFSLPTDSWDDHPTRTAVGLINDLKKQIDIWDERKRCQDEKDYYPESTDAMEGTLELSRDIQQKNDELQRVLLNGLGKLGFHPADTNPPSSEISTIQTKVEHGDGPREFQCHVCSKKLDKQCKLTKHMKRHDRPYACTYPNCKSKPFGSKNDWKRHENSRHFQLQCWRCHVQSDVFPFAECNRLFYRREKFIRHLRRQHNVTEESEVSTYLKTDEIGRNGQSRFWCGFCRKIISLQHRGMDAWNERFNHIDEQHFKRGERIQNWQQLGVPCSDSPTGDDYERNRKAEHDSDNGEVDADNGSSNDSDAESNSEGDKGIAQKPSPSPGIRISGEQSASNGTGTDTETHLKSARPYLTLDTSLTDALAPQTQKRKFASASIATSGSTQTHGVYPKHANRNQLSSIRQDNLRPPISDAASAKSYQENTSLRSTARNAKRTATAEALFSITPQQEKARKVLPTDIVSCVSSFIFHRSFHARYYPIYPRKGTAV